MSDQKQPILIVADIRDFPFLKTETVAAGFEPSIFQKCKTALKFFEENSPQVIIISCNFDPASGIGLCRKIKRLPQGKFTIILLVGLGDDAKLQEEALLSGADWCMPNKFVKTAFKCWLKRSKKDLEKLRAFAENESQINVCKNELDELNDQLEYAMGQANLMTQDAQKSYIEINQIFKAVSGGIVLIDLNFNVIRHNEMFLHMVDDSKDDLCTKKCFEVFRSSLCDTPNCPITCVKKGEKRVDRQITRKGKSGKPVHYSIMSSAFYGIVGELQGIVEHITDITRRVEAEKAHHESEKRYKKLSTIDELTGLFNKRSFNKTLQREIKRAARYGQPLSLIMMDIDNFKHMNDTYGHTEGDKVLARLGELLLSSLRDSDQASRYGGEEFTVILPATDLSGAKVVAERIRRDFAAVDFFPSPDIKINKTLSLGVSQFKNGDDNENLVKRADNNLYEAKRQGKNCVVAKN